MSINNNKEKAFKFDVRQVLTMTEIYSLITLGIFSILSLVFFLHIDNAFRYLFLNAIAAIAVVSLSALHLSVNTGKFFKILKLVYVVPIIYLCYMQVQNYIAIINPHLYDEILIQWDRAIFGTDPTVWIFSISNPILTEYLQICYFLFFFLPIIHGIELYKKNEFDKLDRLLRTISFGFFFSYFLYLCMPAIGPRFFLHDFHNMNVELPGLFLTNIMRDFINLGGGIQAGTLDPIAVVNRDCMPSGHTMMTLINIYLLFRNNSVQKWVQLVIGLSLIFSTIYLRYHYVVDILAGAFFAFLAIYLEQKIRKYFQKLGFKNA